jgi:putative transposase
MPIKELCRKGGFSDATFYKWRAKYGGMDVPDARRLRELESENAKLKKLLAEAHLDIHALKGVFGVRRYSAARKSRRQDFVCNTAWFVDREASSNLNLIGFLPPPQELT